MKIAILSSATGGGAGIAAFRIFNALKNYCTIDWIDAKNFGHVHHDISPQISASNNFLTNTHFTIDHASLTRTWIIDVLKNYDVINIHWCSYLLSLSEIYELANTSTRIVFTLHDFYYFTGGCHYPSTCKEFMHQCLVCPQVNTNILSQKDVNYAHKLKRKIFEKENVFLTAPSNFVVNSAIKSGIVPPERAKVIRNCYNPIKSYYPTNVVMSDRIKILLIADSFGERRKLLQLAIDAFKHIANNYKDLVSKITINLIGKADEQVNLQLQPLGFMINSFGHIKQHEKIVDIYSKSNLILCPSNEDNWPNVLVESSAYGVIPIVGPRHGCEEFVKEFEYGFIFKEYSAEEVAKTLALAINEINNLDIQTFIKKSRTAHSNEKVSMEYLKILGAKKNDK